MEVALGRYLSYEHELLKCEGYSKVAQVCEVNKIEIIFRQEFQQAGLSESRGIPDLPLEKQTPSIRLPFSPF